MKDSAKAIIYHMTQEIPALKGLLLNIEKAAQLIIDSYQAGGKVLVCGNGGSASDAMHITGELMNRNSRRFSYYIFNERFLNLDFTRC